MKFILLFCSSNFYDIFIPAIGFWYLICNQQPHGIKKPIYFFWIFRFDFRLLHNFFHVCSDGNFLYKPPINNQIPWQHASSRFLFIIISLASPKMKRFIEWKPQKVIIFYWAHEKSFGCFLLCQLFHFLLVWKLKWCEMIFLRHKICHLMMIDYLLLGVSKLSNWIFLNWKPWSPKTHSPNFGSVIRVLIQIMCYYFIINFILWMQMIAMAPETAIIPSILTVFNKIKTKRKHFHRISEAFVINYVVKRAPLT